MELALFTPGAYIWPVYRNLEAFIAALAAPAASADRVSLSAMYPARERTDSSLHELPQALDRRLSKLHREIYDALLRPVESFRGMQASFADHFLPDLRGTALDALFAALAFYFVHQTTHELGIVPGLSVVRGVFLNHEASEPDLWLQGATDRLADERRHLEQCQVEFFAPLHARLHDLAFCLNAELNASPTSTGWVTGRIKREFDGGLVVRASCGFDPSLLTVEQRKDASPTLQAEMRKYITSVFGWQEEEAA